MESSASPFRSLAALWAPTRATSSVDVNPLAANAATMVVALSLGDGIWFAAFAVDESVLPTLTETVGRPGQEAMPNAGYKCKLGDI